MASRILNRRELRKQSDEAEQIESSGDDEATTDDEAPVKKKKPRAKSTTPKVRKPRKPKAPPRLRARWGLFDGSMKQVAIFDFNDRAGADEKLADLREKKKGSFFMQIVKEEIVEPTSAELAAATAAV